MMAWLWACLFLLPACLLPQAVAGVGVKCLWEKYFHIGRNVSGACWMNKTISPGCRSQSLHLTANGKPLLGFRYGNDITHFTIPEPAEGTLHLRCELTCASRMPHSYCDITLQGGYPPHPVSRPECHIPYNGRDIHCSWDPGPWSLLDTNYTLYWEQPEPAYGCKGMVMGNNTSAVISKDDFCKDQMSVWVVAENHLASVRSETASFHTFDIEKPPAPVITEHSLEPSFSPSVKPSVEIFWKWKSDMFDESQRSCEVRYRTLEAEDWTVCKGEEVAFDSFLLEDPEPYAEYVFQVRCSHGVMSDWSEVYTVLSSEAAPDGKLDVWRDCGMSDGQSECVLFWKELPRSVARGKVLGYLLTVERSSGNVTVMNLSTAELEAREGGQSTLKQSEICSGRCIHVPLSLRGVKGVYVMAYTSHGRTDPAPLALPITGSETPLAPSIRVAVEGRSFNVSWATPSTSTEDTEYVVQCKEAGHNQTRGFHWIKLNGTQRNAILTGNHRNYTPYSLSLLRVFSNYSCLLGSVIVYTVQGVPPEVTNFQVSLIKPTSVTLTWQHIPLALRRGVILRYRLGQDNHTVYNVSGDSSSLLLWDLQPGQRYQFWICAETVAGQGPRTHHHFITMTTNDIVTSTIMVIGPTLILLLLLVLMSWRLWRAPHWLCLGWCCEKVPDPKNSGLLRQIQYNSSWPGFFSLADHSQKLSYLEVVEIQAQERDSFVEVTPVPEGQKEGWVNEGQIKTEEEDNEVEEKSEDEWTETGGRTGSELAGEGEDYSQMIDTEGREEPVSWSPTEAWDIFSGYEKHFMPSPLDV